MIGPHADVTVEATTPTGATVTYALPVATDELDTSVTVTCLPASGSAFVIGTTTVICSAIDSAGNAAVWTSFHVVVTDTSAPVIAAAPGIVVDAVSPSGAVVTYVPPTASDANDGPVSVTCLPVAGSLFPIGITTVTCTADDGHGNSAMPTTFPVEVKGAADQISDLRSLVHGVGLGHSLETTVQAAQILLARGYTGGACVVLNALRNETRAEIGHKLTAAQAATIIAATTRIRAVLAC